MRSHFVTAAAIVAVASIGMVAANAAPKRHPGAAGPTCTVAANAVGEMTAAGSGLQGSTAYQYELYDANRGVLRGNVVTTDASGSWTLDFGPATGFSATYAPYTVELYPIIGGRAHMDTIVASCSTV
jgi:hypothetical protein